MIIRLFRRNINANHTPHFPAAEVPAYRKNDALPHIGFPKLGKKYKRTKFFKKKLSFLPHFPKSGKRKPLLKP